MEEKDYKQSTCFSSRVTYGVSTEFLLEMGTRKKQEVRGEYLWDPQKMWAEGKDCNKFSSAEISVGYRQIMFGREDKIVKVFNYLTCFIDLFSLCIPRECMLV